MIIILDAGHGYKTPGKQSPNGMHEYEFNREVALFIKDYLTQYHVTSIHFVHDDTRDVPLKERTKTANELQADLYVSIHANAFGSGNWHEASGIETYIYETKPKESLALAEKVQNKLVKSTKCKNRGIKAANFQVLRETKCPAILIECGFMTNKQEAALLKTTSFRKTCGQAIASSIIEHYQLQKKEQVEKLYKVQIGAFKDKKNAEALAEKLRKLGFEAIISEQ